MNPKLPSGLLLVTIVLSTVVLWNPTAVVVSGISIVFLLIGVTKRRSVYAMAGGWLAYLPISFALKTLLSGPTGYLVSGVFVILVGELIAFDNELSRTLASYQIDKDSLTTTNDLSKAHRNSLGIYTALAGGVMFTAALASGMEVYASELIVAAILLMLVIMILVRR